MTEEQKRDLQLQLEDIKKHVPNLLLLGFGGSFAYGTNIDTSDVDIRGIYMNPIEEILSLKDVKEQYESKLYDSVIYSFKKIMKLFTSCNPNTIEMLGLREQDYLHLSPIGQKILDNKQIFLSQRAIYTFGEYANNQLNRLINHSSHREETATTYQLAQNETRSLQNAMNNQYREEPCISQFQTQTHQDGNVSITLHVDNTSIEKLKAITNTIIDVHRNYSKMNSKRNQYAIEHGKVPKHAMHLIRLYMMAIDILEKQEINTYRNGADHELLIDIRKGKDGPFIEKDNITPTTAFHDLLSTYQTKMEHAKKTTTLPKIPNEEAIFHLTKEIYKEYFNLPL